MIGKPKYDYGDKVSAIVHIDNCDLKVIGTIEIIDKYGTFKQNEEVSYDILVDDWCGTGTPMFVKHVRESRLTLLEEK